MINLFNNLKEENKVYYCKHIAPGVCGYLEETIFIGEETLKKMDRSFSGKPIFIEHREVNPETEKQDAVGYVIESFYLPEDGTHWAKILIIEDSAHNLIKQGWKVSNAYQATGFGVGGEWHNIPYNREVTDAHYTHLALVDNPRYEEAEILTPEEFKKYKEEKQAQIEKLQNSKSSETKQGEKRMFKLWKKTEVTNSDDISKVMVELSNGTTVSVGEMVNSVEKDLKEKESKNKCNEDDIKNKKVKVNGEDMTVGELIEAFEKKDKKNEDEEDKEDKEKKDKKNESEDEDKEKSEKKDKKNESDEDKKDEEKKDKKNEDEEDEEKKKKEDKEEKKDKKNSKDLLEAEEKANSKEFTGIVADTMSMKLARGQERYGSK